MVDYTTYQPHMEEAHMANALNNLTNFITSEATNLTNLTMKNTYLEEQINVALAQNKVLI